MAVNVWNGRLERDGDIIACDLAHSRDNIAVKTIILSHAAAKDLDGLSDEAREAVQTGLVRYAMTGVGDVKPLSGREGFRLRIGAYRVIFDEDASTILAIYVGKRQTTTYRRN
jgi:mRNA interferase RelE/StbE